MKNSNPLRPFEYQKLIIGLFTFFFLFQNNIVYSQYGQLNPLFGNNGVTLTDIDGSSEKIFGSLTQPDGKIVTVGTNYNISYVARYHQNGSLDSSFGVNGIATFTGNTGCYLQLLDIQRQTDGKYLLMGNTNNFTAGQNMVLVKRINSDGTIDNSFGYNGNATINLTGTESGVKLFILNSGKIIVAGHSDGQNESFLCRLNNSGTVDTTFHVVGYMMLNSSSVGSNLQIKTAQIAPDGKIVLFAYDNGIDQVLARINIDGGIDNAFGINGKMALTLPLVTYNFNDFILLPDSSFILAGNGRITTFALKLLVAKVLSNGALDLNFGTGGYQMFNQGGYFGQLNSIAIQTDNKIVGTGRFESNLNPNNVDVAVIRLHSNGQIDNTFGSGGMITNHASAGDDIANRILQAPNGTLVVTGYAQNVSGILDDFMLLNYTTGLPTNIENISFESNFSIKPNPVQENIHIDFNDTFTYPIEITIHDISGSIVAFDRLYFYDGSGNQGSQHTIPVSNLSSGMYFLKLAGKNFNYYIKFIKVH